jgi:hypothetical protein
VCVLCLARELRRLLYTVLVLSCVCFGDAPLLSGPSVHRAGVWRGHYQGPVRPHARQAVPRVAHRGADVQLLNSLFTAACTLTRSLEVPWFWFGDPTLESDTSPYVTSWLEHLLPNGSTCAPLRRGRQYPAGAGVAVPGGALPLARHLARRLPRGRVRGDGVDRGRDHHG